MMSGRLYIDGVDVYREYGVYVVEGGWNELLSFPPLKPVKSNDWQEEDGIEADLSAPVLNTRELTIKFAVGGVNANYGDFIELLNDNAYHTFNCVTIGAQYTLRLVSHGSVDLAQQLGFLSIRFANDFPPVFDEGNVPVPTGGGVTPSSDFTLDEKPLSDYGVRVLDGSLNEIKKGGTVKQGLLRNIGSQGGAVYDEDIEVHYKSKDVKLRCLLRADNLSEMWQNYYALLHDLIQPEERSLFVEELDTAFACFYKSSSVTDFSPNGRVWLEFTLTLTFCRDFRFNEDIVLATEDDYVINTEDSDDAIDLRPDKI